jgi:hypothetical protein
MKKATCGLPFSCLPQTAIPLEQPGSFFRQNQGSEQAHKRTDILGILTRRTWVANTFGKTAADRVNLFGHNTGNMKDSAQIWYA